MLYFNEVLKPFLLTIIRHLGRSTILSAQTCEFVNTKCNCFCHCCYLVTELYPTPCDLMDHSPELLCPWDFR